MTFGLSCTTPRFETGSGTRLRERSSSRAAVMVSARLLPTGASSGMPGHEHQTETRDGGLRAGGDGTSIDMRRQSSVRRITAVPEDAAAIAAADSLLDGRFRGLHPSTPDLSGATGRPIRHGDSREELRGSPGGLGAPSGKNKNHRTPRKRFHRHNAKLTALRFGRSARPSLFA